MNSEGERNAVDAQHDARRTTQGNILVTPRQQAQGNGRSSRFNYVAAGRALSSTSRRDVRPEKLHQRLSAASEASDTSGGSATNFTGEQVAQLIHAISSREFY